MPLDTALLIPYSFTVAKKNDAANVHWIYFEADEEIILSVRLSTKTVTYFL